MSERFSALALTLALGACGATTARVTTSDRAAIEAALKRSPDRADLLRDLGWVDFLGGERARARAAWERAEKLAPNDPRTMLGRAADAQVAGRYGEARERWAAILERSDARDPW